MLQVSLRTLSYNAAYLSQETVLHLLLLFVIHSDTYIMQVVCEENEGSDPRVQYARQTPMDTDVSR